MLGYLLLSRMKREAASQIAAVLSHALIQQCRLSWFCRGRCLGLHRMNRNLDPDSVICLVGKGSFQKLSAGIIVGNQLLEQQHEVGDVLFFNYCLQATQRRFDLHCIGIPMADIASNLGVRSWDQMLILQVQFFIQFLAWAKPGILNLDVSFRLEPREKN